MRVVLILDDRTVVLRPGPHQAESECECPACAAPLAVRGDGRRVSDCDRYFWSNGYCVTCGARLGEIRAYPSTLFGIEEDERVLNGRARVY